MRTGTLLLVVGLLGVAVGLLLLPWINRSGSPTVDQERHPPGPAVAATYVGSQHCRECHPRTFERWAGSHHDLAMQVADEDTVLGDFDDSTFTHHGLTSSFFRRGEEFFVRTDGPDGELHDYRIDYTFGVTPLQQYLIEFPAGRHQALSICWDSRPAEQGGQGWFHLYPDEQIDHRDALHWTGPNQNWNYMCAECHSTNLRKGYDLHENRYETTWSEIDVACEACHGPGSAHLEWAEAQSTGDSTGRDDGQQGLVHRLRDTGGGAWIIDPDTGTARRTVPRESRAQIETCARCHARRGPIRDDYVHGRPLLDTHRLALLTEPLYHADGQIEDEVYVYGSFIQSKMYREGVTCTDCHDPHRLDVYAPGNAICYTCHQADRFDTPDHHFHQPGDPGASCLDCHMPARNYMVVDPRRDHSFRVPRPDLSVKLGTPNACNQCHPDQSAEWAADAVARWYGPDRRQEPHFGEALHAGRAGQPGAGERLSRLVADQAQPAIARATALALLARNPAPTAVRAAGGALADEDPLVRAAALSVLELAGPDERVRLAAPLLEDPVRAVRIEAARVLASRPGPRTLETPEAIDRALEEAVGAELANADRAEARTNIGNLAAQQGRVDDAESWYRSAMALDPRYVPAYVNLADLCRSLDRDDEGERVLRRALERVEARGAVHHALGLLLVRQGRIREAIEDLALAATLEPDNARFSYVYAIALDSVGESTAALRELEGAHRRHPFDRDTLAGLVMFHLEGGDRGEALRYARKLIALAPDDPATKELLRRLESPP